MPGAPSSDVSAGEPSLRQGGDEALDVLDCQVEGRDADTELRHGHTEVDPDAAAIRASEGQVVVADAEPDADRGDPEPGTLDPPRRQVALRRGEPEEAEVGVELFVAEVDVGVPRPNADRSSTICERRPIRIGKR